MIRYLSLLTLFFFSSLYGEGFGPLTMVATPGGYMPIHLLNKGHKVLCSRELKVGNVRIHSVEHSCELLFSNGEIIWAAADQRFYLPYAERITYDTYDQEDTFVWPFEDDSQKFDNGHGWVKARDLEVGDQLGWTKENQAVTLTSKKYHHHHPVGFFSLEINDVGSFCLRDSIEVHNFPWVASVGLVMSYDSLLIPATWALGATLGIGLGVAGVGILGGIAYYSFKNREMEDTQYVFKSEFGKPPPDEPDCDPNFPWTCGYEDAGYHHGNSKGGKYGGKSKAPKDGLTALRNSIPFSFNSRARIGVSEGELVKLSYSGNCLFHGHVIEWKDIDKNEQLKMKAKGLVDRAGRPLK